MQYLNFLVLLTLISCSGGATRQTIDDTQPVYQTSGMEQFFLTELPNWANFSSAGQCLKSGSFHYLDFSKLLQAYQLNYVQMVELQAQYNERLEDYYRSTAVRFLKPLEQSNLFSNTLEQVRGGVRNLKIPTGVTSVDIIWLESFFKDGQAEGLKKMAKTGRFDEKLPILFSSCFSRQRLEQWVVENNLESVGFHFIAAEWLSPFGTDFAPRPGLQVSLKEILGPTMKVNFISGNQQTTRELLLP